MRGGEGGEWLVGEDREARVKEKEERKGIGSRKWKK